MEEILGEVSILGEIIGEILGEMLGKRNEIMKHIEKPKVFLGFGVRHGADVTKTLCFPRVLRARLQKP